MKNQLNWKLLVLAGAMILWPLFGAAQMNLDSGLVAYYPFNGNANDESGNGNDGTVQGATLTNDENGIANKAYEFDGIDDWINMGNSPDVRLNDSSSLTLFGKIHLGDISRVGDILRYDDGDNSDGDVVVSRFVYLFRVTSGGNLNFEFGNPFGTFVSMTSQVSLDSGMWYSVAAVRNTETDSISIFINGDLDTMVVDPTTGQWETTGQYLMAGRYRDGGQFNHNFKGKMDELRVYKRALSQPEIAELSQLNTTGVQQLNKAAFKLSPNPARGAFTLRSPQAAIQSLTLYDLTGRRLPAEISHDRHEAQVLSSYRGLALVKVQTDQGIWAQKVLLE